MPDRRTGTVIEPFGMSSCVPLENSVRIVFRSTSEWHLRGNVDMCPICGALCDNDAWRYCQTRPLGWIMAIIIEGNLFEYWTHDLLLSERLKFPEWYAILLLLLSRKLLYPLISNYSLINQKIDISDLSSAFNYWIKYKSIMEAKIYYIMHYLKSTIYAIYLKRSGVSSACVATCVNLIISLQILRINRYHLPMYAPRKPVRVAKVYRAWLSPWIRSALQNETYDLL